MSKPEQPPTPDDAPRPREFVEADLRGARFVRSTLAGAVMRGVDVNGVEIDSPWLLEPGGVLVVNGVDVAPFVDAELNARMPGREQRRASDPEGLRSAWAAVELAWAAAVKRARSLPEGTVDVSVDGEWSFAQTLRHLVMATDTWLRGPVLGVEAPYHPLGLPNEDYASDGYDTSVFADGTPAFDDVLEARADRVAMVREFIAGVTPDELVVERRNPWAPQHPETTLSCLHTILEEEWEHLRYATRDLDAVESRSATG